MKDRTEWDLLVIAEGIEQGSTIIVENDHGEEEYFVFVKEKDGKTIILKDSEKDQYLFSKISLEEVGGNRFITGAVEED